MIVNSWDEPLKHGAPMAAARMVRRNKYAWPGGYAMTLVTSDGECLCPRCVADNFHEISSAHRRGDDNGWRPLGVAAECNSDTNAVCAHCSAVVWGDNE